MASVLMVASEGLPFVKTGGLADVIGSLPGALADQGNEVKVVLPLYRKIAEKYMNDLYFCCEYTVSINYHEVPVRIWSTMVGPVAFFFVQHQGYFERDSLYGYDDDGERFAYFQKAVIEMFNQLNYWPNIVHCHDWQTAMIPCMVRETHDHDDRYRRLKFVLTLHNMAYQGNFGPEMLDSCLGLPWYLLDNGNVRYDGGISFLKSGILYSDKVTTVSPTYAQEILTPQFGEHLEMVLNMRKYDLWGIVNGIDLSVWNPATDPAIPHHYNKVIEAETVIISTGATAKYLGLEDEQKYAGMGVSACATCDGFFYRKKVVAVVGGGDTACEEALCLSSLAKQVYLIVRKPYLRASKVMQERVLSTPNITVLFEHNTIGLFGEGGVEGAHLVKRMGEPDEEKVDIAIDGFFLAIGHTPNSRIFKPWVETDEVGYIKTIPGTPKTRVPGVFAAGDVADPHYRQAITAAGSGCAAAIEAERYLSEIGK